MNLLLIYLEYSINLTPNEMDKVLTVEVNLNLKADESLQQIVAYIFGQKLSSQNEQHQPQPVVASQPVVDVDPDPQPDEAKPKRTRSKKAEPKPQPTEQPDEQPTEQPTEQSDEQPTEQPAEKPAEEVSLEEIKEVFFAKLAGHRDEIRAKINELGAPSLSLIAPEKRSKMLEFLKGLD